MTCRSSALQAAWVYSLIRPPRTDFRRICLCRCRSWWRGERRVRRRGRAGRCPGAAGQCCSAPDTRSGRWASVLAEDQHAVQDLAAQGADEALADRGISVRRGLRGCTDDWLSRGNTAIVGPRRRSPRRAADRRGKHRLRRDRRRMARASRQQFDPADLQPQRHPAADSRHHVAHGRLVPPPRRHRGTGIPARQAGVTAMTVLGVNARHADLHRHPNSTNPPPAASTIPRPPGKAQSPRSQSNSTTVPGRLEARRRCSAGLARLLPVIGVCDRQPDQVLVIIDTAQPGGERFGCDATAVDERVIGLIEHLA